MRKAYTIAIIFFVLSVIFNQPETENGVSLLLFMFSLVSAVIGFFQMVEDDEKNYFGDNK